MATVRWHDSATTLLDGNVLVIGAACAAAPCPGATIAELFDPATNLFRATKSPLNAPRTYALAVLLVDGRVLIASAGDASLEIYDPDKETFTLVPRTVDHAPPMKSSGDRRS